MILRFSSTIKRVHGCTGTPYLLVAPIAGVDTLYLHAETRLVRQDRIPANCTKLRPGLRIEVCGEDEGGNRLMARQLVLTSGTENGYPRSYHRAPGPLKHCKGVLK